MSTIIPNYSTLPVEKGIGPASPTSQLAIALYDYTPLDSAKEIPLKNGEIVTIIDSSR